MTTLKVLTAARAKIADKKNWTQGWFALRLDGDGILRDTDSMSTSAVCWCSTGAIRVVLQVDDHTDLPPDLISAFCMGSAGDIEDFNDTHTHAEVLAAFDQAIATL